MYIYVPVLIKQNNIKLLSSELIPFASPTPNTAMSAIQRAMEGLIINLVIDVCAYPETRT